MDITCLAENLTFPVDSAKTGINLNEMVVGPTGSGKTFSTVLPRIFHSTESSEVIAVSKHELVDRCAPIFRDRGYEVMELNCSDPALSDVGYDPMHYVHTEEDGLNLAHSIVQVGRQKGQRMSDEYWDESTEAVIAAEIDLIRLNAMDSGKKASMSDVVKLNSVLKMGASHNKPSNLLPFFEKAEENHPGCMAYAKWMTVEGNSDRTNSNITSMVNMYLAVFSTPTIRAFYDMEKMVDIAEIGRKKTALFIVTNPTNAAMNKYVNVMYADFFRILFEEAERRGGRLPIPVHIICDDFACGCRIPDFENYISVFRAAGMSVTLLLQSESQLTSIYDQYAATTIINNCDTYVYLGGNDLATCRSVSARVNKPVDKVMQLPLEMVYVFRRGAAPVMARRYQTMDDPVYREYFGGPERDH